MNLLPANLRDKVDGADQLLEGDGKPRGFAFNFTTPSALIALMEFCSKTPDMALIRVITDPFDNPSWYSGGGSLTFAAESKVWMRVLGFPSQ